MNLLSGVYQDKEVASAPQGSGTGPLCSNRAETATKTISTSSYLILLSKQALTIQKMSTNTTFNHNRRLTRQVIHVHIFPSFGACVQLSRQRSITNFTVAKISPSEKETIVLLKLKNKRV